MPDEGSVPENPPTEEEEGQIPATSAEAEGPPHGKRLATVALMALGVVYGDIGTSPLYALRQCFSPSYGIQVNEANVLGILSLIVWSLLIVISTKYLVLVMRADNRGEGGILALMALVADKAGRHGRLRPILVALGLFGAALLYGDGSITPAISVLSAVEGVEVATPAFSTFVVPITVAILIGLFVLQRRGTAAVGSIFGPVVLSWFLVIGLLGAIAIAHAPHVLTAFWPGHAVGFFLHHAEEAFFVLGAVFLVVTGGEALYADMGHFGSRPIRLTWFCLVLPALLLNYFGQGALLLSDPSAVQNPFYHLAPGWAVYPLVLLATVATVIASQAIISGAFSLTRQAVYLGYSPRMKIEHTSGEEIGQVYIGFVNWVLCIATVGLVVGFGSSSALAGAYGVAVSITMVVTTLLLAAVMRDIWGWPLPAVVAVTAGLLLVDLSFLAANSVKVPNGGWYPLLVAAAVFTLMSTWQRGRELLARQAYEHLRPVEDFLADLDVDGLARAQGTAVFLTGSARGTPGALIENIEHNQVLHQQVVLLTISTRGVPYVRPSERIEIDDLGHGFWRIQAGYGFMQSPRVPRLLRLAERNGLELDLDRITYFVARRTPIVTPKPGMAMWRERLFALMMRSSQTITTYFDLPPDRVIEIGSQIEI